MKQVNREQYVIDSDKSLSEPGSTSEEANFMVEILALYF